MNKPVMKQEVAIQGYNETFRVITFYATQDAVTEFEGFGRIKNFDDIRDKYNLYMDARFDFAEVLAYIQNYGKVTE